VADTELSDQELSELAGQVASGDVRATERLFLLLLPRVRNLVRYLVRGDREVDDLSQDALVTLLRGMPTYRGEGAFRSWADRVVARSVFAARKRVSPEQASDAEPTASSELNRGSEMPSGDAYCQRREMVTHLDTLPEGQRAALVLHYVLGLTVPEVSEELGVPQETVRSRLRLGKNQLRQRLDGPHGRMVG
jgi:RNA polymerase sigma-70 factor (ECF subfamily)